MTNDDSANALFIISIKLDLASNLYKTAGELEKIKNANAKKMVESIERLDKLSPSKETKEMINEAKRLNTYFEDYIASLKKLADLSRESVIGD